MQTLRPYQTNCVESLIPAALKRAAGRGPVRRVVAASPCGSGKTSVLSDICRRAAIKGSRVLVIAHRRKLVRQIAERLLDFGVPFGVVMADLPDAGSEPWAVYDPAAPVQVASRDTLFARSGTAGIPAADVLIVDEAHVMSPRFAAVEAATRCRVVLGFTATPCRADGSGLSAAYWHELVTVTTIEDLLALDPPCLVRTDVYAPVGVAAKRRKGLKVNCSGDPVRQWFDHAEGLRTVTFCASVPESIAVRDAFKAAGVGAEHLDADSPDSFREEVIGRLRAGELEVVTNFDIVGIGVDIPELECVQLLTKCVSVVRLWQCVGRGQRPAPGKQRSVLLDHAAATAEHGMPNVSPEWSLDESDSVQNRQQNKMNADENSRPVVCRACGMVSAGSGTCPGCKQPLYTPTGKVQETGREPLSLVEGGAAPLPKADPRQRHWTNMLYMAAAAGWPCRRAAAMFRSKYGVWPEAAGVSPLSDRRDADKLVGDVFPHFRRKAGVR